MKLVPLDIKLSDSQFIELKKYSALQIAAAFGVKPNQINDYTKSSYSNSEMQQLSFLTDTMLFVLKQYEEEVNYKLLSDEEALNEGKYFKLNEKCCCVQTARHRWKFSQWQYRTALRRSTSAGENWIYRMQRAATS